REARRSVGPEGRAGCGGTGVHARHTVHCAQAGAAARARCPRGGVQVTVVERSARPALRDTVTYAEAIGHSRAFVEVLHEAARLGPLEVPVLISSGGRSGNGKTTLARIIHENSARHAGAFVELSCATIPVQRFEAKMFGSDDRGGGRESPEPGIVAAAEG